MSSQIIHGEFSRRRFLHSLSLVAGAFLAGCSLGPAEGQRRSAEPEVLEVEIPYPQAVSRVAGGETDAELSAFLLLSSLLTGVDDLDPAVGRIYLQSLQAKPEIGAPLNTLLQQVGDAAAPPTLIDLENSGVFEDEQTRQAAGKLTEYWYTGIYEDETGEPQVATYVDALAWKALTFTKPMSVCGTYRFWTEPPELDID